MGYTPIDLNRKGGQRMPVLALLAAFPDAHDGRETVSERLINLLADGGIGLSMMDPSLRVTDQYEFCSGIIQHFGRGLPSECPSGAGATILSTYFHTRAP